MSEMAGKADIAKRRFDHFQSASLTRYGLALSLGAVHAAMRSADDAPHERAAGHLLGFADAQ